MKLKSLMACGCLFLLATDFLLANERGARLFQAPMPFAAEMHKDIAALYGSRVGVLRRYAWAMSAKRHGLAKERIGEADRSGFIGTFGAAGVSAFIGRNEGHVLRLGNDALIIARGKPLENLYTEINCEIAERPVLVCEDGRSRSLSAPDATSIRIEGETFEMAKNDTLE